MSTTVHTRCTSATVIDLIRRAVASVAGTAPASAYSRGLRLRVGLAALSCIQEAFVVKAAGGTGEDGIQWAPLKKETIANRPLGPSDVAGLKSAGIRKGKHGYSARSQSSNDLDARGRLKRGFLTQAQDQRWRKIFSQKKAMMMARHGLSAQEAGARAAAIAWATLKAEGAKTKLEMLGNRRVQIGRSSGRLFSSLSPGLADPIHAPILTQPEAVEDRILREEPGEVVVGSNVSYAGKFHRKRPLWPSGELPPAWSQRIAEAAASGIAEMIGAEARAA